ncbi:MAG: haloacid dehalogenase-like hydrolase [Anaerolineae bacterium]|jgi:hypothetical protein|nr:haloacid dehalogenase-like hydrolase [Anaerolineae bacterium]
MAKRLIEASPSILAALSGKELLDSLRICGGRAVSAEVVAFQPALIDGVSNAALSAAFGADIIHFNHYDVDKPQIAGMPSIPEGIAAWEQAGIALRPNDQVEGPSGSFFKNLGLGMTLRDVRQQIGRVVGVSLEVDFDGADAPAGRVASPETARKALAQGAAYITLIGTPAHTPDVLAKNILRLRQALGDEVVLSAGRMPWGGSRPGMPDFLLSAEVETLAESGANIVVIAAPGTMPGATIEEVQSSVNAAHRHGLLAKVTIGTSQESADESTVIRLALDGKLTGADIFQIGDGGFCGMSIPESILAFSIAIKGRRHTYRRMAMC